MNDVQFINGGIIAYNILTMPFMGSRVDWARPLYNIHNTSIANNIVLHWIEPFGRINNNCSKFNNMSPIDFGEDCINIAGINLSEIFINPNGVNTASDFHFKDEYKQYESQVGIYAGSGFNDKQMAPVPYITFKDVDEETDAAGKLKVKIRVKASE